MTSVNTEQCEDHRDALYGDISKKAGSSTLKWFGGILVTVLFALAGTVLVISVAQGKSDAKAEAHDDQDRIGREYRDAARTEQQAWQNRVDKKLDDIQESIYTHNHTGSTP